MFGAEADGILKLNRAFVGKSPDAERFRRAADEAVGERGHGERDEDQSAGLCKLEVPPDRDPRLLLGEMLHQPDAEHEVGGLERGGIEREDVGAERFRLRSGMFRPEQLRAARIAVHDGIMTDMQTPYERVAERAVAAARLNDAAALRESRLCEHLRENAPGDAPREVRGDERPFVVAGPVCGGVRHGVFEAALASLAWSEDGIALAFERAVGDGGADAFHQGDEVVDVVDREQARPEDLVHVQQVPDVGAREVHAGVATAARVERGEILGEASRLGGQGAAASHERRRVARQTGRHHAVEHVDAEFHAFEDLFRGADAHQVARLVLGQERGDERGHVEHLLLGFADGDAADSAAVEVERGDVRGGLGAEVVVHAALHDAEPQLMVVQRLFAGDLLPAFGHGEGFLGGVAGAGVGRAFVERHYDVGAQVALDAHGFDRAEEVARAVDMRGKFDAVRFDLAERGEAEDLESAAIGQDGAVPVLELVNLCRPPARRISPEPGRSIRW